MGTAPIGAMAAGAGTSYFGVWVLLPPFVILLALALSGDNVAIEEPVHSSRESER
jgi:hypothetical protein